MAISLCIKGREEMTEKIIIKPSVQKRFDSFMVHGRVLFFSAPCGFGKTVLADALLRGQNVLRQSAAAPDWAIPSSAQDWDILLIDDLQLMQEEAGQQALCELIRSSPERHFVLLSRGAPLGCLMAFQYTGLMTVLEADDLLFDADDVRRLFQLSGANVTDNEIDGILKESLGYPLGVAITARCMSQNKPWTPELVARVFHEVFLYFETAIYRRFDLPVRRFLLELAPFESFDLEMARMVSGDPRAGERLDWLLRYTTMLRYDDCQRFHFWSGFRAFLLWEMEREYTEEKRKALISRGGLYYELKEDYAHALECYTSGGDHSKVSELLVRNAELHPGMGHYAEMEKYYRSLPEAEILASPSLMQGMSMLCALVMDYEGSERWYGELQKFVEHCGRQGDGSQDIQVNAVDVAGAVLNVRFQRGEGQLRRVRSAVLQLHHGLGEILIAPHDVQVRGFARGFFPIPCVRCVKVAGVHVNTAEHGVHIGQKACQTALGKAFTEHLYSAPRIHRLSVCQLAAGQKPADGELHVRRAPVADLVQLREKGQHPSGDVRALFKFALGNGAVGKTHTVPPQYCLHGETEGFVEQVVLFAPFGKVLAAVHDARQRARDGEGRQRQLFVRQQPKHGGDGFRQTLHAPLGQGNVQPRKATAGLLSGGVLHRKKDERWRERLTAALDAAAEYRFIRTVSVYGTAVLPLLEALDWDGDKACRKRLMAAVRTQAAFYPHFLEPRLAPGEELTPTELQILHLLCADKSNTEIAQIMDVKLSTVKTHVSHILDKLDVKRRAEAKTAAKKLHLVPDNL